MEHFVVMNWHYSDLLLGVAQFTHSPSCCPSGSTLMLLIAASSRWHKEDLGTPSIGNSGLRTSHQPDWIFLRAVLQYETLPISPPIFLSITGVRPTWQSEGSPHLPCPPFFILDKYFPQQIFYTSNPVFLSASQRIHTNTINQWQMEISTRDESQKHYTDFFKN